MWYTLNDFHLDVWWFIICHNLTLGLWLNVKCKGPWNPECVQVWNTFSQTWENARDEAHWLSSALPFWELHLCENCECLEPWLKRKTSVKIGSQDTIKKVLKCWCLKCLHIVHLDLICMSYDQKKGRELNWKFDSQPQILGMQKSNDV